MKKPTVRGPYYAMGSSVWCRDPKRRGESTGIFSGQGFPVCLVQFQVLDKNGYAQRIADALNMMEESDDPLLGKVIPFTPKGD